jgi:hypothetical protein
MIDKAQICFVKCHHGLPAGFRVITAMSIMKPLRVSREHEAKVYIAPGVFAQTLTGPEDASSIKGFNTVPPYICPEIFRTPIGCIV